MVTYETSRFFELSQELDRINREIEELELDQEQVREEMDDLLDTGRVQKTKIRQWNEI